MTFDAVDDSGITDELLAAVESEVTPADVAVVVYTSGSAAEPKAVVHTHGTVVRKTSTGSDVGLPGSYPGHRVLCAMPFFWVGGVQMLAGALHSGSAIVCQERFDAAGALDLIERERVTTMLGWSTTLTEINEGASDATRDLSSLDSVPLPASTVGNRLRASSKGDPPNLGMTETFGPHYRPDHFDYKIVDPATGETLPDGEEGEFCVRGYGLMAGFYKREREETFDADGWYHTGDRSYLEDGRVFFTGRYTEMIKSGGANVAPLEVETVLQSFPEIRYAFVFGMPHAERGEEVTAVLVLEDGAAFDPDDIRRRLRAELSAYKVPTSISVIALDEAPWLPSGKPDKLTLKQRVAETRKDDAMTETLPTLRPSFPSATTLPPDRRGGSGVTTTCSARSTCSARNACWRRRARSAPAASSRSTRSSPCPIPRSSGAPACVTRSPASSAAATTTCTTTGTRSRRRSGTASVTSRTGEHGHYGGVPDEEHGIHFWARRGIVGTCGARRRRALARGDRPTDRARYE